MFPPGAQYMTESETVHCPNCYQEYTPPPVVREPGDFTICPGCAAIMVLSENLAPRKPTVYEWSAVLSDPDFLFALKRIQLRFLRELHRERLPI
jgi:hypothetical protein